MRTKAVRLQAGQDESIDGAATPSGLPNCGGLDPNRWPEGPVFLRRSRVQAANGGQRQQKPVGERVSERSKHVNADAAGHPGIRVRRR